MAGLFPLFTDAHVQQRLVRGLRQRGWDVVRAIDVFPEKTPDDVLFEYAAKEGRVFVTNDEPIHKLAMRWLSEGRPFPGLVFWRQERYREMTTGDFLKAFDALADLALVDWYLPLLNGYDAARIMLEANRLLRVVIMSGVGHHRFVMRALRAGVRGYFLKSEEHPQRVLPALRTVVGGEIYLTPSIASLRDLASYPDRTLELLTPRLRQILQLIAERMATKEIARLLGLSERTVESHRLRIMDKLGIRDRVGLIHYAYEEGLVRYRALDGLQDSNPFPR